MAKRISNRKARLLLYVPIAGYADTFKISNRRWQVYSLNYPFVWQYVKSSRRQKQAKLHWVEWQRSKQHG